MAKINKPLMQPLHSSELQVPQAPVSPISRSGFELRSRASTPSNRKNRSKLKVATQQREQLALCWPLFYRYVIIAGAVVVTPLLVYSIVAVIANKQGSFLEGVSNGGDWALLSMSSYNSLGSYNQTNSFILYGVALLLVLVISVVAWFVAKQSVDQFCTRPQLCHQQPFAVLFRLQRPANYTQEQVVQCINEWYQVENRIRPQRISNDDEEIVEAVYFHFNMQAYEKIKKQLDELTLITNQNIKNKANTTHDAPGRDSNAAIIARLRSIQSLKQQIRNRQLEQTNKFVVVFKNMLHAGTFRSLFGSRKCRRSLNQLVFPGQNYSQCMQAPFPHEIAYHNQHFARPRKVGGRLANWAASFGLMGAGAGLEYLVLYLYASYGRGTGVSAYAGAILGCVFVLVAESVGKLSTLLVSAENQPNLTHSHISHNTHFIISSVFLKAVAPPLLYMASKLQLYESGGVIQSAAWLIMANSACTLLFRVLNFRVLYFCFLKQPGQSSKPSNHFELFYSEIISLIATSFTYTAVNPLFLAPAFFCLAILLFIQRINLACVYDKPRPSGSYLFVHMMAMLWKCPFFLALGSLYFVITSQNLGFYFSEAMLVSLYIVLAVTALPFFIPANTLDPINKHNVSYDKLRYQITNKYSNCNPLYTRSVTESPKNFRKPVMESNLILEQLNTMSRSLELTLREKLFGNKARFVGLESLGNKDEESELYFEFDTKVEMPERSSPKRPTRIIPPIFKPNLQDITIRKKCEKIKARQEEELVKMTELIGFEEEQQKLSLRKRIKQAIKESIYKIK